MGGGDEPTVMEVKGMKKGPWTATEDAILSEYVNKHGEGNWNAVQKNTGLLRCGKSCRLRWANHLRPDLKKGAFSPDEERIIIELHAKLGNKWARMASQLPGRTDNEIKNYWNTRMKRRQRQGLPLYPQEANRNYDDEFELDFEIPRAFLVSNQDGNNLNQNMIQFTNSSNASSSSSSYSSSSSHEFSRKRLCPNPLITTNPSSVNLIHNSSMNYQMISLYNNSLENDHNSQFGFSFPLSSSSSSNEICNPNKLPELTSENSDTNTYNENNIDHAMSFSSLLMGDLHEITPTSYPLGLELPSNQTPTHSFTSNTILDNNSVNLEPHVGNSGLLDALLEESQALSRGGTFNATRVSSSDLSDAQDQNVTVEFENRLMDNLISSHQSSLGTNPNVHNEYNESTMVRATVDDEDAFLTSLLNNFPSNTPLPDLYQTTADIQPEVNHQGNGLVEPSTVPSSTVVDPIALLGSCYWNNMPSSADLESNNIALIWKKS